MTHGGLSKSPIHLSFIIIIIIIKAYTALIQTVLSALQFINSIKYDKI